MITEERQKVMQKAIVRWPCGVYGKGIGYN